MLIDLEVTAKPAVAEPGKPGVPETAKQPVAEQPLVPRAEPETDEEEAEEIVIGDKGGEETAEETDTEAKEGEAEAGEAEEGEEGEDSDKPLNRNQRKNRKLAAQQERITELEAQLRKKPATEGDELKAPVEKDFPDYLSFDNAMREFQTRKVIREEDARRAKSEEDGKAAELMRVRTAVYNERLGQVKDRIPDFTATMREMDGVEIRNDVRDAILESPKGPLIAYHLAKNPDKLAQIHAMPPLRAAQEIGRLEARIRGPQAKKQTSAPAPVRPPKGGAVPRTAAKSIEDMDMDEYVKGRENGTIV